MVRVTRLIQADLRFKKPCYQFRVYEDEILPQVLKDTENASSVFQFLLHVKNNANQFCASLINKSSISII